MNGFDFVFRNWTTQEHKQPQTKEANRRKKTWISFDANKCFENTKRKFWKKQTNWQIVSASTEYSTTAKRESAERDRGTDSLR